jgi:hypothetical protein
VVKKTLNAKNLAALGVERLAELLIEISAGDAAANARLRLELAGAQSPDEAAREIRKRLSGIKRSRTFVDWQAMIDFLLDQGRSSRYRHASRHLMDCASLALSIPDFGKFETHETFVGRLRTKHGKKGSFWSHVP